VIFEPNCRVSRLPSAFSDCPSLRSICIPAALEIICKSYFERCISLSSVRVQPNSKLTRIDKLAFCEARSFESVALPGSFLIDAWCLDFCLCFRKCFLDISEPALRNFREFLVNGRVVRKPTTPPNARTPFVNPQVDKRASLLRSWMN
jgi:hypothetical protein